MKRHSICFLLAALLAIGSVTAHAAGATGEIEFMTWGSTDYFEPIVDAFQAAHPGITVKLTSGPYGEHLDKFLVRVASGNPPDVGLVDGYDYATVAARGMLTDVTDWAERDGLRDELESLFHPSYLGELLVDGRLYSVAMVFAGRLMTFYNKDLVSEAGLADINESGDAWTWSSFLEMTQKMTKDTDSDGRLDKWGFSPSTALFWPWILMNGGQLINDDRTYSPFDRPENYEAVQWLVDLNVVYDVTADQTQFLAGNVGIKEGWESGWMQNLRGTDLNWDIAAYPAGKEGSITISKGNELVIPYNAPNKELAWEFLKFSASADAYYLYGKNQVFFPPRRDAALRLLEEDESLPEHFGSLLNVAAEPLPVIEGFRSIYVLWNNELRPVWRGEVSPREAGERIAQRSAEILAEVRRGQ